MHILSQLHLPTLQTLFMRQVGRHIPESCMGFTVCQHCNGIGVLAATGGLRFICSSCKGTGVCRHIVEDATEINMTELFINMSETQQVSPRRMNTLVNRQ